MLKNKFYYRKWGSNVNQDLAYEKLVTSEYDRKLFKNTTWEEIAVIFYHSLVLEF